jgi:AsmA protein
MNAHVIVELDYVELGKAFNEPIAPFKAELDLNKGKMSLAKVSAKTADGTLSGVISVDAHQVADKVNTDKKHKEPSELPEWRIEMQWKDINLEKWLRVSKDRKETAAQQGKEIPPAYVTGTLNGKTSLAGKGNSTAELLGSLNGDVSIYIHHGTISHLLIEALVLDIAQALGVMIKGDQLLPMQCAVMDLKARQGIVTPDVALIDTPVTLILFDGNMDLAQEKYNLRLIAKPKNVSPFTVRSPILIKGTFLKPVVSAEPSPIALRVLGAVALAFINPLAAILPFIDTGAKDDHSSCSEALAEFNKASAAH